MHIVQCPRNVYVHTQPSVPAEVIAQKGLSNVTVDTLVQEMTPKARSKGKLMLIFIDKYDGVCV